MYKLYHTTSGISLLLHDAETKPSKSVSNNDIPQVRCVACISAFDYTQPEADLGGP